jgi:hypothetical protein
MECGCGHGECLRSKQFMEDMFLDMREGIKGVGCVVSETVGFLLGRGEGLSCF